MIKLVPPSVVYRDCPDSMTCSHECTLDEPCYRVRHKMGTVYGGQWSDSVIEREVMRGEPEVRQKRLI